MIYFKMEKIGNSTHSKEKKTRSENLVFQSIPAAGVEPARPCGHWILSPVRLPIPPCWHMYMISYIKVIVNLAMFIKT